MSQSTTPRGLPLLAFRIEGLLSLKTDMTHVTKPDQDTQPWEKKE